MSHDHKWERMAEYDQNEQNLKYRCACGVWGFGNFVEGAGLRIRPHSASASAKLERLRSGGVPAFPSAPTPSSNVDSGYEPLRERDS